MTGVTVFDLLRIEIAGATSDQPMIAGNPFDSSKQLGAFVRFPSVHGGVFVTVQNPFTAFASTANHSSACTPGVDRPNGDEPNMPLLGVASADDCATRCMADPACKAFAFIDANCRADPQAVSRALSLFPCLGLSCVLATACDTRCCCL